MTITILFIFISIMSLCYAVYRMQETADKLYVEFKEKITSQRDALLEMAAKIDELERKINRAD